MEIFQSVELLSWLASGLFVVSELAGQTKAVKSNGILSFLFNVLVSGLKAEINKKAEEKTGADREV